MLVTRMALAHAVRANDQPLSADPSASADTFFTEGAHRNSAQGILLLCRQAAHAELVAATQPCSRVAMPLQALVPTRGLLLSAYSWMQHLQSAPSCFAGHASALHHRHGAAVSAGAGCGAGPHVCAGHGSRRHRGPPPSQNGAGCALTTAALLAGQMAAAAPQTSKLAQCCFCKLPATKQLFLFAEHWWSKNSTV